jgi:hypothetical protein
MKACWCILGGTKACDNCANGPSSGTGENPLSYGYDFKQINNFQPANNDQDYLDRCAIAAMAAIIMRQCGFKDWDEMAFKSYNAATAMWEEKQRREGK